MEIVSEPSYEYWSLPKVIIKDGNGTISCIASYTPPEVTKLSLSLVGVLSNVNIFCLQNLIYYDIKDRIN